MPLKPIHPWKPNQPDEQYVPSHQTDIRERFARIGMEKQRAKREARIEEEMSLLQQKGA